MSRSRKLAMLMLLSVASTSFAMAQSMQTPPSETQPAPRSTEPSSASTPHQRQAMHDQMMKDCMKKQKDKDPSMSKDQMKKNCQQELKSQQPTG